MLPLGRLWLRTVPWEKQAGFRKLAHSEPNTVLPTDHSSPLLPSPKHALAPPFQAKSGDWGLTVTSWDVPTHISPYAHATSQLPETGLQGSIVTGVGGGC